MPKINVYLPDELADAVKEAGVPVSAICQRALEQSVRRVTAIRATVLGDLETDDPTAELSHFTDRARTAVKQGIDKARADGAPQVGTEHLLHGVLAEDGNLALQVLRVLEVEPDHVARALAKHLPEPGSAAANQFSGAAANALELAVTEAIALGHNYIGCEHLLLGLLGESEGLAGEVLRQSGVELRATRRAVQAALTGYAHLRAQSGGGQPGPSATLAGAVRQELQPVLERIERLEQHAGLAG